ncbi:MAG: hypothetical protein BHW07_00385 [Clostridium sp. CAG_433_25_7]|nr:MAG: hypothetical protein BHW07_00385 [Clostridium sp. CAG_433_25_7]
MNYYDEIKNELINNEVTKKVKDYSKNKSDLTTYYNVGKLLAEAGKHYGEGIIKEYSDRLSSELNIKYSVRTLYKIIKYFNYMNKQKVPTVSAKLSWSHYDELLKLTDENIINYYIKISEEQNLSVRELRKRIKNNEYERLDEETKKKLKNKEDLKVPDLVKNPIQIKNTNDYNEISEKVLKKLILENIESFMNELGNSFSFIGSEYKIKIDDRYNYIDLLLFNIEYNCYVVVELKITELKKEHIGQIEFYMNYIDKNLKNINQNKTIGIIICKKENKYVIEYCSDDRIIAREYELI